MMKLLPFCLLLTKFSTSGAATAARSAGSVRRVVIDSPSTGVTPIVLGADDVLLVNSGGDVALDPMGRHWMSDNWFSGGVAYNCTEATITDTDFPDIYQTERYGLFQYEVPVANGLYEITLHFAEVFWSTVGSRVFNIEIEGDLMFEDFDIVAEGGGVRDKALVYKIIKAVTDGYVTIALLNSTLPRDNPKISAFELRLAAPGSAETPKPLRETRAPVAVPTSAPAPQPTTNAPVKSPTSEAPTTKAPVSNAPVSKAPSGAAAPATAKPVAAVGEPAPPNSGAPGVCPSADQCTGSSGRGFKFHFKVLGSLCFNFCFGGFVAKLVAMFLPCGACP
jgi:Malectin domain